MSKKTVIIGGVAGGASAAARLRRRDEQMEIVILEKGAYISYANCGLPYYIGNVIQQRQELLLHTPESMESRYRIDVRILSEVIQIKPEEQVVLVKNLKTQEEYEESYDNLIIATGSSPIKPNITGINQENIFTVWTVPDTDQIKQRMLTNHPKTAVIIGGGFIGLEMAENLCHAGIDVTLVEMKNQVMPQIDFEMAGLLHENIRKNHVSLILEDGVKSFEKENNSTKVVLNSKKSLLADIIILTVGIKPNSLFAKDTNIVLNEKGGIVVDEYLRTSIPNIYAVGDVIEVNQYGLDEKAMIPLAGPANKQGRIVADNIVGDLKQYKGTLGTSIAKVFDLQVAVVGVSEKLLHSKGKEKGTDYETVLINQKSHAGYYPGTTPITLKMIFDNKGNILGAQIVGRKGVDKRIDTIATTMRLHGTIYDLAELELAYAPPFSSAKDPVNMLGFVAENVIKGLVSFIEYKELDTLLLDKENKSYLILDVTEEIERRTSHVPGSYHIPLGQLRARAGELEKDKTIIIYCAIGVRAYNAARYLIQSGFCKVKVLSGGISFYNAMHSGDKIHQKMSEIPDISAAQIKNDNTFQ